MLSEMSSKSCASTYLCTIWWWHFCSLLHNGMFQYSRSASGVLEIFMSLNPAKIISIELNCKYLKRLFIFLLLRIENMLLGKCYLHSLLEECFKEIFCTNLTVLSPFTHPRPNAIFLSVEHTVLRENHLMLLFSHSMRIHSNHVYQAPQLSKNTIKAS